MNIQLNQVINHILDQGTKIKVQRVSHNSIEISSPGEIDFSILLPENFQLEKEALEQLVNFAHFKTSSGRAMKCACATPDFHKGSSIPVGAVVVSDHDIVIPGAIGTDINCGMRLHHMGIGLDKFLEHKKEFLSLLKGDLLAGTRDIPTTDKAMQALFEDGLGAFWTQMQSARNGIFSHIDFNQVKQELNGLHASAFAKGNVNYAPEGLTNKAGVKNRQIMRDPNLGTLGGGNHFCEVQVVKELVNRKKSYELGLKVGDVVCMIHTGSRDVGFHVVNRWTDIAKAQYPKDLKYPHHKIFAIEGELAGEYLSAMHTAAHYATANRALIAECVRQRAYQSFGLKDNRLIVDVPHNICLKEDIGNVHRKGATPAYEGQLLIIPGSMGAESYLVAGLGSEKWLKSSSHGAGRSFSRNEISFKGKKNNALLGLEGVECITLKEERKNEEAPGAYKQIGPVIQSQSEEGTIDVVAVFSPLVTFKA